MYTLSSQNRTFVRLLDYKDVFMLVAKAAAIVSASKIPSDESMIKCRKLLADFYTGMQDLDNCYCVLNSLAENIEGLAKAQEALVEQSVEITEEHITCQ